MGFGAGVQKKLLEVFQEEEVAFGRTKEEIVAFVERLTDSVSSKDLAYKILDSIASEDYPELVSIVKREFLYKSLVLSVSFREFPELFYRRMYIPLRLSFEEMALSILTSLRTSGYEECYLMVDGRPYYFTEGNVMKSLSLLDLRDKNEILFFYGKDSWCFTIQLIGITMLKEKEVDLPFLVEDAVGYGIMGMHKMTLIDQLMDSIDQSTDTKNPIMDDEEFEFYNADTDELNETAMEEYKKVREHYFYE